MAVKQGMTCSFLGQLKIEKNNILVPLAMRVKQHRVGPRQKLNRGVGLL